MLGLGRLIGLAVVTVVAATNLAAAETVAEFYAGKTFTIVVGSDVGGGYDTNARLLSRHIGKFIPGNPTVIVQNRPGAGSITAANYIYNTAPKDGTVIGMVQRGIPLFKLTGQPGVQYDPEKYTWIGNMSSETGVVMVWHTSPITKTEELFTTELVVGGSGSGAENETGPRLLNAILGTKFKIISGYKSQTEALLAMERGEIAGIGSMSWPTLKTAKGEELKSGKVKVLMQSGLKRDKDLPNVPLESGAGEDRCRPPGAGVLFHAEHHRAPDHGAAGRARGPRRCLARRCRRHGPGQGLQGRRGQDRDSIPTRSAARKCSALSKSSCKTPADVVKRVGDATNPNAK